MKLIPQSPDNGAVITLNNRIMYLTWKQLYELAVGLSEVELCRECYRPVEPESSMGNGYHPGCFVNMMDRNLTVEKQPPIGLDWPEIRP